MTPVLSWYGPAGRIQWALHVSNRQETFSEKQASEVLELASRISEIKRSDYTAGITRQELENMAAEIGVDPSALAEAIAQIRSGGVITEKSKYDGEERVVNGEISPEDFDLVFGDLKASDKGELRALGRSFHGKVSHRGTFQEVKMTSRNGRSRLSVVPRFWEQRIITWACGMSVFIIPFAAAAEAGKPMQGLAGSLLLAGLTAYVSRWWDDRAKKSSKELADELEAKATDVAASAVPVAEKVEETAELEQRLGQGN